MEGTVKGPLGTFSGTIRMGLTQITRPTPKFAKNIFRFVLYASVIANIIVFNIPDIPDELKVKILAYSSMATAIVHAVSKLFGIDITDIVVPKTKEE